MDFRVLAWRGVAEDLGRLSAGEALTSKDFKSSREGVRRLLKAGLVEVETVKTLVREETLKEKRTLYELTDKGRSVLEVRKSLDPNMLKLTPNQLEIIESLGSGGRTRRELPKKFGVDNLIRRGLVRRSTTLTEVPRRVYGKRRVYRITEKGREAYDLYNKLKAL